MAAERKRYRAFISYSQRDKAMARRLHYALEAYRVPAGVEASLAPDRRLGRFFLDDEEMGASQSLGAALEGALDDSENLIGICTSAAAQAKWVDAEVRRFKTRENAKVFAVPPVPIWAATPTPERLVSKEVGMKSNQQSKVPMHAVKVSSDPGASQGARRATEDASGSAPPHWRVFSVS